MPDIGVLEIFCYRNKNKKPYYLTFYEGEYHIVDMKYYKIRYLCEPKITKSGKPYIEYTGAFILDDNSHIVIE